MPSRKLLIARGAWVDGTPLRLHLGCGEQLLPGYVNIDYPRDHHNVMRPAGHVEVDLTELAFAPETVDEVRLHHVFEHFNRVVALGLLVRWHTWLRIGGRLCIETPDFIATASATIGAEPREQIALVRHLEGDQAAPWAYHVTQWFPGRFERVLKTLGFDEVEITREVTPWHAPPLHNVTVRARKSSARSPVELTGIAKGLLAESKVSPHEAPTHQVWCGQLDRFLLDGAIPHNPAVSHAPASKTTATTDSGLTHFLRELMGRIGDTPPIGEIQSANQRNRDAWVRARLAEIPDSSRVLDVGAGTCPYRADLSHTRYEAHDFTKYEGYIDTARGEGAYGRIDHVSDILALPVPDASFDAVLCTEVLEHVPEPIAAVVEMARVLKPGGRMILTAPLGSGLHQEPFHFYGGYTPHWYRFVARRAGLDVVEITPNGGFFQTLAQECARVAWMMGEHRVLHGEHAEAVGTLFGELLPRYLASLDQRHSDPRFTVGYHVVLARSTENSGGGRES